MRCADTTCIIAELNGGRGRSVGAQTAQAGSHIRSDIRTSGAAAAQCSYYMYMQPRHGGHAQSLQVAGIQGMVTVVKHSLSLPWTESFLR